MLLINTRQHQRILIGDKMDLDLVKINYLNGSSNIHFDFGVIDGARKDGYLALGDSTQLCIDVAMTLTKVLNVGDYQIAVLGFQAPRQVQIMGEWLKDRSRSKT